MLRLTRKFSDLSDSDQSRLMQAMGISRLTPEAIAQLDSIVAAGMEMFENPQPLRGERMSMVIQDEFALWPHQQEVIDAIKACEPNKDGGEPVYGIDTGNWEMVQKPKRVRFVGTKPDAETEHEF